jgi:hypothetical protein
MLGTTKYGMAQPVSYTDPVAAGASNGAVAAAPAVGLLESPAVWAVAVAAVMLGLIGVNTSGRIGPLRASISAGKA